MTAIVSMVNGVMVICNANKLWVPQVGWSLVINQNEILDGIIHSSVAKMNDVLFT
jgi:hypothetical protein